MTDLNYHSWSELMIKAKELAEENENLKKENEELKQQLKTVNKFALNLKNIRDYNS